MSWLICAYELAKNSNNKIEIYEASNQVWGLLTLAKIEKKYPIEATYHHAFTTDTHLKELCIELEIEKKLLRFPSSTAIYYKEHMYNFMTPKDLILYNPLTLIERLRLWIVTLYLQKKQNGKTLGNITASKRCKKHFGQNLYRKFWSYLLQWKFGSNETKVSMAWLRHRIYIRSLSKKSWTNKEILGYFEKGYNVMIERLLKIMKWKVKINLNTPVKIIDTEKKIITTNNRTEKYDAIIITTPTNVTHKLIQGKTEVLESIDYIGEVNTIITSRQSLSNKYRINVYEKSSPFLVFIQHTNLVPTKWYGWKHVYYLGKYLSNEHAYLKNPKEFEEKSLAYLQKMFPQFDRTQVTETQTFAFRNAQHIVTIDYEKKIPPKKITDWIYLLNFSQIYPEDRWINYAIKEAKDLIKNHF